MEGLTPRQEKFCVEFASCGNARQAYISAGYKGKNDSSTDVNACRLLKNDKVIKRLQELHQMSANSKIADVQEMQERLTAIIRMETREEQLMVEGVGNGVTKVVTKDKAPSNETVIKAIQTLGKMQGAFVEKVEQSVDMDLNISIDYGEDE